MLRRVLLDRCFPLRESLGPAVDERFGPEPFSEDHPRHAVEHGDVGARVVAQPEVGVVAHLDPFGVEHDQLHALLVDGPPHAARDDGVVGRRVRAHDEQAAGVFVVGVRVGRRAAAQLRQHRFHRRRVAQPRAVIDVVGAHQQPHEFLDQVVVFVGGFGAGEGAERASALDEPLRDEVQRFVPRGRRQPPAAPDQGRGEPVGVVHERGPEAPLHAQHPLRRSVRRVVVHAHEAVVGVGADIDAAAHAAVGADGGDRPHGGSGPFLRERAGGADGDALPARGAGGVLQGQVAEWCDSGMLPGAGDPDRADVLDVVAGHGAAGAEDALAGVEEVEGVRLVQVRADAPAPAAGVGVVMRCDLGQFGSEVGFFAAVPHRQRQFDHALPDLRHFRRLRPHHHPVLSGRGARGRRARCPFDLHEAGPAGPDRGGVRVLAQMRQRDVRLQHGVEDTAA